MKRAPYVLRLAFPACLAVTVFAPLSLVARADQVDDTVVALMVKRKIPGLSLAVFKDGAIVKAKGYGFIEGAGGPVVTADTLFQAGSISKPVSALGALLLVEKGKLSLDANVNDALTTWRVPENEFTSTEKVTLRRILSHSAGLTVHGFPGYDVNVARPTLVQVLDGAKPANTAAIRVDVTPGSRWRYAGGGYTVMQQLVIDVSDQTFPEYMRSAVLEPLGMAASTFEQPLPAARAEQTATGHYPSGSRVVPGRWHIYPEMAAAGLWTTPSDLARFAIAIQDSYAGRRTPVISSALTQQMLTRQKNNFGLGLSLAGKGATERFEHNGRDEGFDAALTAYRDTREGAVVMINANENTGSVARILESIAEAYQWPDYPRTKPAVPIEDKEPTITEQIKGIFQQAKKGEWDRALFGPELNQALAQALSPEGGGRAQLNSFGAFVSIALIGREDRNDVRTYRYRIVYATESIIVNCAYRGDGIIVGLRFQPE